MVPVMAIPCQGGLWVGVSGTGQCDWEYKKKAVKARKKEKKRVN
jgi:hypothetical protein